MAYLSPVFFHFDPFTGDLPTLNRAAFSYSADRARFLLSKRNRKEIESILFRIDELIRAGEIDFHQSMDENVEYQVSPALILRFHLAIQGTEIKDGPKRIRPAEYFAVLALALVANEALGEKEDYSKFEMNADDLKAYFQRLADDLSEDALQAIGFAEQEIGREELAAEKKAAHKTRAKKGAAGKHAPMKAFKSLVIDFYKTHYSHKPISASEASHHIWRLFKQYNKDAQGNPIIKARNPEKTIAKWIRQHRKQK